MARGNRRASKSRQVRIGTPSTKTKKKQKEELTRLGSALRTLGGLGGGILGNFVGDSDAGKGIGRSLGATVSRWLGSGDYAVASNTLLNASGTIPAMHSNAQSVIVRHKEFVGILTSSEAFSVQHSLPLNPGLEHTFPWLSRIAAGFQEYRIKGMIFHYVPSSGDAIASTNPALGTVMLQTSYRSTDTAPTSKLEILNEYWATESVPSHAFCHPIECDPRENPFNIQYVRTGSVPTGETQLMYDLGITHVAVQGMQTTGNPVGDLWVTYEVELKKPIIHSNVTSEYNFYQTTMTGTASSANYWAGLATATTRGNLDVTLVSTGKTITLPSGFTGRYGVYLELYASGGFTAATMGTSPTVTNCRVINYDDLAPYVATYTSAATATSCVRICNFSAIEILEPSSVPTFTYGANSWTGSAVRVTLTIFPYA